MKWYEIGLEVLKVLPALASTIISTVKVVERPGHGPEKKAAVKQAVEVAFDSAISTAEEVGADLPQPAVKKAVMKAADGLTDLAVGFFNKTGW